MKAYQRGGLTLFILGVNFGTVLTLQEIITKDANSNAGIVCLAITLLGMALFIMGDD
jgi:hypothetical protein